MGLRRGRAGPRRPPAWAVREGWAPGGSLSGPEMARRRFGSGASAGGSGLSIEDIMDAVKQLDREQSGRLMAELNAADYASAGSKGDDDDSPTRGKISRAEYKRMVKQKRSQRRTVRRTEELQRLFDEGTPRARRNARRKFAHLVSTGQATASQFHVMMKWCSSSDEMRGIIEKDMPRAGIDPDTLSYNMLVSLLRVEGDEESARRVFYGDSETSTWSWASPTLQGDDGSFRPPESGEGAAEKRGPIPDTHTTAIFAVPASEMSRLRTRLLSLLHQEGTPDARRRAHALFRTWVDSGLATPNHFAQMMKWMTSSEDMRRFVEEEMPSAGVTPDAVCFTMLVDQLVLEGDASGAHDLVYRIMPEQHGITRRDKKTIRALEGRSEGVLLRQRSLFLKKRLHAPQMQNRRNRGESDRPLVSPEEQEHKRATALRFFDALVRNGVADTQQFNLVLLQRGENGWPRART